MSGTPAAPGASSYETTPKTQVQQVRSALLREFDGLIDVEDLANKSAVDREQAFLSRAWPP